MYMLPDGYRGVLAAVCTLASIECATSILGRWQTGELFGLHLTFRDVSALSLDMDILIISSVLDAAAV